MMRTLRVILWDQLSLSISSLEGCDLSKDLILMCELSEDATYVKHHKKKLVLLWSAMRHFSQELLEHNCKVKYIKFNHPENSGILNQEIIKVITKYNFDQIVVTEPGEFRVLKNLENLKSKLQIPVEIRIDQRFLCSQNEFASWVGNKKQLRMEYFYRQLRKKYSILMQGEKPIGGKWNYDSENRKFPSNKLKIPTAYQCKPDQITQEVIDLVATKFKDHFGNLENFNFAVTRKQALKVLTKFIKERLRYFGDYQDAMLTGEPWMYHSHISFYLNAGLLNPLECVRAAEKAYYVGEVPLNAAEGFIRQIIGWREYVRGIYWLEMPKYKTYNFLQAHRKLPNFYWTGNTKMNCIKQCVGQTNDFAYAHHIQRLMVLGNFALITGIRPDWVNEWYLIVYADAYEWVELPNVTGMILFADGGYLASKPYAASGNYINKMSDYCSNCYYKVQEKTGVDACPFNYLYWDFMVRNQERFSSNQRLSMVYKNYKSMPEEKKALISKDSKRFLKMMDNDEIV